jgi:hypothetical protein
LQLLKLTGGPKKLASSGQREGRCEIRCNSGWYPKSIGKKAFGQLKWQLINRYPPRSRLTSPLKKGGKSPPDHRSEISPEKAASEKSYQKGIVALFKNTASEWIQVKCPQLGAALAYFAVFSLAPLVLVLLAVFGLRLSLWCGQLATLKELG